MSLTRSTGDNTIFEDLGLDAKNYGLKTTWTDWV